MNLMTKHYRHIMPMDRMTNFCRNIKPRDHMKIHYQLILLVDHMKMLSRNTMTQVLMGQPYLIIQKRLPM